MPARAFIVRPFGTKKDLQGQNIDFDAVQKVLIAPAFKELDLHGSTTTEIASAGNIREDMFELLVEADLVVADVSIHNANVFYELGIRHALRDRRTFLIRCRADANPFDLATDRYLEYDRDDPAATLPALIEGLRQTIASSEKDSPLFRLVPGLVPQDPAQLIVVPQSFGEEVDRRRVDGQPGDLDLLADEVMMTAPRWLQQGLRVVGLAQFDRRSWEGAKHTWEAIREVNENDVQANVKLATVYAKLGDLTRSNQAIERALSQEPGEDDLAELYSLRGSNEKTEWMAEWSDAGEDRKRRALVSPFLQRSFEAYLGGFLLELNHFYSGLNALTLLSARLALAEELPDTWIDGFEDEDEAERVLKKLKNRKEELQRTVSVSLEATQGRVKRAGTADLWLDISVADLTCVSGDPVGRVDRLYRKALAKPTRQQLDSVDRQLEWLELLSINPEQVAAGRAVVKEKRSELGDVLDVPDASSRKVLIFTGHRVDAPDRATPRFPAGAVPRARAMIEEAVRKELASAGNGILGIAGAASGGDILFHEVCEELGIETHVYLAGPRAEYVQESVQDSGQEWVDRFNQLLLKKEHTKALVQLGDSLSLPRWLAGASDYSVWQRNNLWTLHNAMQISGAAHTVLIALWNGQKGDGPGGTNDMTEKAKTWGARSIILPAQDLVT